jgi:glucose uptake protein
MLLPTSSGVTIILLVAAMLCWGLWANTLKMAGKTRYELYYLDFTFGFVVLAVVGAITLGSANSRELTFQDNLAIAGYRKIAYCMVAGFVFNLATMLLASSISIAGLGVASVLSFGMALVVGVAISLLSGESYIPLELLGAAIVFGAVALAAHTHYARIQAARELARNVALQPDPRDPIMRKKAAAIPGPLRGISLGLLSGLFLGLFRPVLDLGRQGDDGVGPYAAALLFAAGILASTLFFAPFLFNFPAAGRTLVLRDYLKIPAFKHLWGLAGGALTAVAVVSGFVAWSAPRVARAAPSMVYGLGHGGAVVAALCGWLVWREFRAAPDRLSMLFGAVILLLAIGITMAALAQV